MSAVAGQKTNLYDGVLEGPKLASVCQCSTVPHDQKGQSGVTLRRLQSTPAGRSTGYCTKAPWPLPTEPTAGRRKVHTDLPAGSGLDRKAGGGIYMHKSVNARTVNVGSVAGGDFPDSPGDGWATALAYRQHMKRVVARLREDPDAEVQVAEVDDRGWRLHAWAPGDESLRPSVLAAIRGALARTRSKAVGQDGWLLQRVQHLWISCQ